MTVESVAQAEKTTAEVLRGVYLEAVAERARELGSPLTEIERRGYAERARKLYPDAEGRS